MKIKNFFASIINSLKKVFERFPLSLICIIFVTTLFTIFSETKFANSTIYMNILTFSLYFALGSFFTESIYNEDLQKRKPLYIIFGIVGIILTLLQNFKTFEITLIRIGLCYVSTLIIVSIYYLYKHSAISFETYILKIFSNFLKNSFIYGVLAIGIAIIYGIFTYLILDLPFSMLLKLETILFGVFYIPRLLHSLVNVEEEISSFIRGFVKYVLSGLVIASFVIIYLYIIKILIFRDIPKNQIFRILSALFIVGLPIWTMAGHFRDGNLLYKINTKLPLLFIPFVFLQIYSMGIRIIDNGFTPARYCSVILIIFEIAYITMYIIKKEKIGNLLLVLNGLIITTLLVPVINMFNISNISQYNRLKLYYEKTNYTEQEKSSIYSAYYFLKYSVNGEKYINKLSENDILQISSFKQATTVHPDYDTINVNKNIEKLDLHGYSNLYFVHSSNYLINNTVLKSIIIPVEEAHTNIDLTDIIKNYVRMNKTPKTIDQYFDSNYEVYISASEKLVLKSLYVKYDTNTLDILAYSIDGYLLK